MYRDRGFTLFEILIVLGLVGCIVLFSAPAGFGAFEQVMLRTDMNVVKSVLRASQLRSLQRQCSEFLCEFDTYHGVHISPHELIVFEGVSYGGRNSEQDIVIPLFGNELLESTGDVVTTSTGTFTSSETITFSRGESSTLKMSVFGGETHIQEHE